MGKSVFYSLTTLMIISIIGFPQITHSADLKNPCSPSVRLEKQESGFGPPSTPSIDFTMDEFVRRSNEYESGDSSNDQVYKLALVAYYINENEVADKLFNYLKDSRFENPYYAESVNFYLGHVAERKGDFEEAKAYLLMNGDPYYIHRINALIYRKKGQLSGAEQEYLFAQSVRLYEMHNYEPYQDLAEMFYEEKDYTKAEHYISKYIACAEWEMEPFNSLGYAPTDHGHIMEAKEFLDKIRKSANLSP